MAMLLDDTAADTLLLASQHLSGPLTGGFEIVDLTLSAGRAVLTELLDPGGIHLVLADDLGADPLVVEASITRTGQPGLRRSVTFEPWSVKGTALAVVRPADGACPVGTEVVVGEGGERVAVRLVRGVFAHLVYLGELETARLRRTLRLIEHSRTLVAANGPILDRLGAELAVPRLQDALRFAAGGMTVTTEREVDEAYRRRLLAYRQYSLPSSAGLAAALRDAGLVAGDGKPVVAFNEADNPFEVTMRLVTSAAAPEQGAEQRSKFLAALRELILIDPGAAALPARLRGAAEAEAEQSLHSGLREALGQPPVSTPLAPGLATALTTLARLLAALDLPFAVTLVRGQDDGEDDRFELGLGAELALDPTVPEAARVALAGLSDAAARKTAQLGEARASFNAGAPAFDALAAAAGLATVLPLDGGNVYVSHLKIGRSQLTGPGFVRPGDAGAFAVADRVDPQGRRWRDLLSAALGEQGFAGAAVDAAGVAAAAAAGFAEPPAPLAAYLVSAGLAPAKPGLLARGLTQAAGDLALTGLRLDAAAGGQLQQADAATLARFSTAIGALVGQGLPGLAVGLETGGTILLVAGPRGVPPLGANLTGRAATQTRWYAAGLDDGQAGGLRLLHAGAGTSFAPKQGLTALIAVTYRREFGTDPYEVRVEPSEGVVLGFDQFERLINLLRRFRPAGVEFNTWLLRKAAVRFDPARPGEPPGVKHERSYRRYQLARFAGWQPASGDDH